MNISGSFIFEVHSIIVQKFEMNQSSLVCDAARGEYNSKKIETELNFENFLFDLVPNIFKIKSPQPIRTKFSRWFGTKIWV